MCSKNRANCQGFSILLVLGVLAVLSALVAALLLKAQATARMVDQQYKRSQVQMMLASAHLRIEKAWRNRNADWEYSDEAVRVEDSIRFRAAVFLDAGYPRLHMVGEVHSGQSSQSDSLWAWWQGNLPSDSLPALVITDSTSGVSLCQGAVVEGDVATPQERVGISTHALMPADGARHLGGVEKNIRGCMNVECLDTLGLLRWRNRLVAMVENRKGVRLSVRDSVKSQTLVGDEMLLDSLYAKDVFFLARKIRIGRNARLLNCQVLAVDTLLVDADGTDNGPSLFLVMGRMGADRSQVAYLGVERYQGNGVFVALAGQGMAGSQAVLAEFGEAVDMSGLIWTQGWLDMRGKIAGNVLAKSLRFQQGETLWQGFLRKGKIVSVRDSVWRVPWMLPRFGGWRIQRLP